MTSAANYPQLLKKIQGRPTMPAMGEIGTYCRERRKALGLTLAGVAAKSGLSEQAISMIELGQRRKLQAETVTRLARGLEVDAMDLLSRLEPVPA